MSLLYYSPQIYGSTKLVFNQHIKEKDSLIVSLFAEAAFNNKQKAY